MATEEAVVTAPSGAPAAARKKKKKSRVVKRIITLLIVLAVLAAAGFAVWYFVFRETKAEGTIVTATASVNTITSAVQGYGSSRAGANAAVSVALKGVIQEVYVNAGDVIYEGMPLFSIYSPDAAAQVQKAQEDVNNARKTLDAAEKSLETARKALEEHRGNEDKLAVRAPFSGNLTGVVELVPGQMLEAGAKIATLVNDRQMRLVLYFSYAYEKDISVGQHVDVSVPGLMLVTDGTVEAIYKVKYKTPEGGVCFEADIVLDNPGTLTEGMAASATALVNGEEVTPYSGGQLAYYGTRELTAVLGGTVLSVGDLRNYMDVEAGDILLTQDRDVYEERLAALESDVEAAEKQVEDSAAQLAKLEEVLVNAQAAEQNTEVTAPIAGTVTSCSIVPDQEVEAGTTVITISDTSVMTVQITVDDRNISYISPGMEIELTDWNGNSYIGVVTKIDIEGAQMGSGMSTYPVTLSVENMMGFLQQGMGLNYSFVTSQSVDCVTVPIQCVKNIVDTDGNPHKVVFIKADEKPENAVEFEMPEYYGEYPPYPSAEEGYWPVPVETGLSDRYNLEITSGLEPGAEIFNAYMMTGAYSY